MNKNQWFVLGIGSILLSMYLFRITNAEGGCVNFLNDGNLYVGCVIKRYAYAIPAIIFQFIGWGFTICGFLEPKKK